VDNSNEVGNPDTIFDWSGVSLRLTLMLFYPLVAILSRIAGLEGEPDRWVATRLAILSVIVWVTVVSLVIMF